MKKKVWSKPSLVVLVRSRPEEAVLNGCKGVSLGADSYSTALNCGEMAFDTCYPCSSVTVS